MRHLLLTLGVLTLFACSNDPQQRDKPGAADSGNTSGGGTVFSFSKTPSVMDMRDPNNWCVARFAENAIVNADAKDSKRRFFAIDGQPHKVVVDYGHFTASFALHKKGNQLEISTSDNYPSCFSNAANFTIAPDGKSFRYDNKKVLHFDVELQDLPNGLLITVVQPSDLSYGMLVNRCETCK